MTSFYDDAEVAKIMRSTFEKGGMIDSDSDQSKLLQVEYEQRERDSEKTVSLFRVCPHVLRSESAAAGSRTVTVTMDYIA